MAVIAAAWGRQLFGSEVWQFILLVWLADNGSYYFLAFLFDQKVPESEKLFNSGSESLKQLLLVEVLDSSVRLFLLWLFPVLFPTRLVLAAGVASLLADVVSIYFLHHSRKLLMVVLYSGRAIQSRVTAVFSSSDLKPLKLFKD